MSKLILTLFIGAVAFALPRGHDLGQRSPWSLEGSESAPELLDSAQASTSMEATPSARHLRTRTQLTLGPSVLIRQAASGWGVSASVSHAFLRDVPILFGIDLGFLSWSDPRSSNADEGAQLLLSFDYPIQRLADYVRANLGISIGAFLHSTRASIRTMGLTTEFHFLIRPGIEIDVDNSVGLRLEPRVGILGSALAFSPQVVGTFQY